MEDDGKGKLPVMSVAKKTVAALPFPDDVRHVMLWAIFNAAIVAFSIAYILIMPSWLLPHPRPVAVEFTDAEVVVVRALAAGMLCCAVSQAAAAALGLMLRRPRHRLLLAYAALVATAAFHVIWAAVHGVIVAAEGGLCFSTTGTTVVIFFSGVIDVCCFRDLILSVEGRRSIRETVTVRPS